MFPSIHNVESAHLGRRAVRGCLGLAVLVGAPAASGAPAADAKLIKGQRPGGHRLRGTNA